MKFSFAALTAVAWIPGILGDDPSDCLKVGDTIYVQSMVKDNFYLKRHHGDGRLFDLIGNNSQDHPDQIGYFKMRIRLNERDNNNGHIPDSMFPFRPQEGGQGQIVRYGTDKRYSFQEMGSSMWLVGGTFGGTKVNFFSNSDRFGRRGDGEGGDDLTRKEVRFDIRPVTDKSGGNSMPGDNPFKGECIRDKSIVFLKLSDLANNKWLQGLSNGDVKAHNMGTTGSEKEYGWILRKDHPGDGTSNDVDFCRDTISVEGYWTKRSTSATGMQSYSFSQTVSRDKTTDFTKTMNYDVSLSLSSTLNFKVGSVTKDITASFGQSWSTSVSNTLSQSNDETQSTTFTKSGTVWQWTTKIGDICGRDTVVKGADLHLTTDDETPCCLPGGFLAGSNEEDFCKDRDSCICESLRCDVLEVGKYAPIIGKRFYFVNPETNQAITAPEGDCSDLKGKSLIMTKYEQWKPSQEFTYEPSAKVIRSAMCPEYVIDINGDKCEEGRSIDLYSPAPNGEGSGSQRWILDALLKGGNIESGKDNCENVITMLSQPNGDGHQVVLGSNEFLLSSKFDVVLAPPGPAPTPPTPDYSAILQKTIYLVNPGTNQAISAMDVDCTEMKGKPLLMKAFDEEDLSQEFIFEPSTNMIRSVKCPEFIIDTDHDRCEDGRFMKLTTPGEEGGLPNNGQKWELDPKLTGGQIKSARTNCYKSIKMQSQPNEQGQQVFLGAEDGSLSKFDVVVKVPALPAPAPATPAEVKAQAIPAPATPTEVKAQPAPAKEMSTSGLGASSGGSGGNSNLVSTSNRNSNFGSSGTTTTTTTNNNSNQGAPPLNTNQGGSPTNNNQRLGTNNNQGTSFTNNNQGTSFTNRNQGSGFTNSNLGYPGPSYRPPGSTNMGGNIVINYNNGGGGPYYGGGGGGSPQGGQQSQSGFSGQQQPQGAEFQQQPQDGFVPQQQPQQQWANNNVQQQQPQGGFVPQQQPQPQQWASNNNVQQQQQSQEAFVPQTQQQVSNSVQQQQQPQGAFVQQQQQQASNSVQQQQVVQQPQQQQAGNPVQQQQGETGNGDSGVPNDHSAGGVSADYAEKSQYAQELYDVTFLEGIFGDAE